jgi:hypothetical protein
MLPASRWVVPAGSNPCWVKATPGPGGLYGKAVEGRALPPRAWAPTTEDLHAAVKVPS